MRRDSGDASLGKDYLEARKSGREKEEQYLRRLVAEAENASSEEQYRALYQLTMFFGRVGDEKSFFETAERLGRLAPPSGRYPRVVAEMAFRRFGSAEFSLATLRASRPQEPSVVDLSVTYHESLQSRLLELEIIVAKPYKVSAVKVLLGEVALLVAGKPAIQGAAAEALQGLVKHPTLREQINSILR